MRTSELPEPATLLAEGLPPECYAMWLKACDARNWLIRARRLDEMLVDIVAIPIGNVRLNTDETVKAALAGLTCAVESLGDIEIRSADAAALYWISIHDAWRTAAVEFFRKNKIDPDAVLRKYPGVRLVGKIVEILRGDCWEGALMSTFTEALNAAYDFNRGGPPDIASRVTRADVDEYIDAHTVERPPDHPTSAIHWDMICTFGESEGRKLLLTASRRWDATPLRPRDFVRKLPMWWEDDYEPQAWVDEYLADVIASWRQERDRLQLCADAEKAWLAFEGAATQQQLDDWREKFGDRYLQPEKRLGPVAAIKDAMEIAPKPTAVAVQQHYIVSDTGKIVPNLANAVIAVRSTPELVNTIAYDQMA